MSPMMSIRRKPRVEPRSRLSRAQDAARRGALAGQQGASAATERMRPTALRTRDYAAERFLVARIWSAPRLEQAGRYVETELGPKVGSLLTDAAHRVEPPKPSRRGRKATMTMLMVVSAAGVAGMVLTRRSAMGQTAGGSQESDESAPSADAMTGGNGHVRSQQ